jgi:hypothetical protein
VFVITFQCPPSHDRILWSGYQQGRQDLNLQPAVLETAALPVELRPFAGWQANLLVSSSPTTRAFSTLKKNRW